MRCARETTTGVFQGINYALAGSNKMGELIALSTHSLKANPEHDHIFLDLPNAFPNCGRAIAAREIIDKCPQLGKMFALFYHNASKVWLRDSTDDWEASLAEEGCVQGCVMGPLVFGFATLPLYTKMVQLLKHKQHSFFGAYSDDGLIAASHIDASEAFRVFQDDMASQNLALNFKKNKTVVLLGKCATQDECAAHVQTYIALGFPRSNIILHPSNGGALQDFGYIHLGVPVGAREYCSFQLSELVEKFISTSECDKDVTSVQQKWVYLSQVIRQKFPFWFRHMCPTITASSLPSVVSLLKQKFAEIGGFEITDENWAQICLPIKSHGCGLGNPQDTITAAFVANVDETIQAVKEKLPDAQYLKLLFDGGSIEDISEDTIVSDDVNRFVHAYKTCQDRIKSAISVLAEDVPPDKLANIILRKKAQQFYSSFLSRAAVLQYEDNIKVLGSPHDKARTLSNDGKFAGAWLHNVPKKSELHMSNLEFRRALMLRLGVPFKDNPVRCSCNGIIDCHVDHVLSCKDNNKNVTDRHNAIVKDFKSLTNHAGLHFSDAWEGQLRVGRYDDNKYPDGRLDSYKDGRHMHIDVTVGNPTASSYIARASKTEHYVIQQKEKLKNKKFLARCNEHRTDFMPLAFEIYGAISEKGDSLIRNLATRAAQLHHLPTSVLIAYWRKRISTTLQVYNARLINDAFIRANNQGGGNLDKDFSPDRTGAYDYHM